MTKDNIQDLLAGDADAQAKAKQSAPEVADKAPDGGFVVSNARARQFKGVRRVPTIKVRSKISGKICIARPNYNPDIYEPIDEPGEATPVLERTRLPETETSGGTDVQFDADEMARMTLGSLRKLPEYDALGDDRAKLTKQEVIDAIVASRG